jgi:hypothetical protein
MYSHGDSNAKGKGSHAVVTMAKDLVVEVPVGYIITQSVYKAGDPVTGTVIQPEQSGQKEIIVHIDGKFTTIKRVIGPSVRKQSAVVCNV